MVPPRLRSHATRATLVSLALMVALGMTSAMALGGAGAPPSGLRCGDIITADTTLDSDLLNCPNLGIVIGADDITLDLNGHLIDGDGSPFATCRPRKEPCDVGVLNDGHDAVTVKHGSVREFGTGVVIGGARHNRVLSVSSSRNQFFGFVIGGSARTVVRDSSGHDNPAPDGDGMGVFGSRHIRILDSSFRHNGQLGIHVVDSPDNLFKGNLISRNHDMGILMEADRNQVRGNNCLRNDACIVVAPGSGNVIARNRITRGGEGIAIEKGRGNVVAGNVVVRVRRDGIRLGIGDPPIGGINTVVRRNLVSASGEDGFLVAKNDRSALLLANVARGGGGDGFDVRSASAELGRNRAVRNGGLGIAAVPGVISRSGNIAQHNGDARQCIYVWCR
jgi:large repetitive protein